MKRTLVVVLSSLWVAGCASPAAPPSDPTVAAQTSSERADDAEAKRITNELADLEMSKLEALNHGSAVEGILQGADLPPAMEDPVYVPPSPPGADSGAPAGTGALGGTGVTMGPGDVSVAKGPTGDVRIGPPEVLGAAVHNAFALVAHMRGRFRACYNRALREDPTLAGELELRAHLGTSGRVERVTDKGDALGKVTPCVRRVVEVAAFAPPSEKDGPAEVVIRATFSVNATP